MDVSPTCPGAFETLPSPKYKAPPLACDTHAHVISDNPNRYPLVGDRSYTPPSASEDRYIKMLDTLRLDRGVLVQISVYGKDNRFLLKVLERHPDRLRGIAVIDPTIQDRELDAMHEAGIRGIRVNTMLRGGVGHEHIEMLAKKIKRLGWHIQFLLNAYELPSLFPRLRKLPVPCVIDHMGSLPFNADPDELEFQTLRNLVKNYGWWVKLSGAYRMGLPLNRLDESTVVARSIYETCPERMLWGSDWPHVNVNEMPDTGKLLTLLAHWVTDEKMREQILVHNPAQLYGF